MNMLNSLALALLFISPADLPAMSGDVLQASDSSTIQTEIPVNRGLSLTNLTDLKEIVLTDTFSASSGEISGLSIIVAQMDGSEEEEDEGDEDDEDEDDEDEEGEEEDGEEDGNTEDTE